MTAARILVVLVVLVSACGGDDEPPQQRRRRSAAGLPANPGAANQGIGGPVKSYAKIPEEFRRELNPRDFAPDMVGDINRDPFRSYLVDSPTTAQESGGTKDECAGRMIAGQFGLRDLEFVGVVSAGTKGLAMFVDSKKNGHWARRGDCLSKDRARVVEIGADRVTIELPSLAPPGSAPPPPRREVWKVHPEDLDLDEPSRRGG